ncbi:ABC transporter ATP-binding protein [Anaerorudis cellulosivorans]|uniref:ABC transporter ATP-binding protein n=1 Tax=Anaerorudis cellulosivorans TaxID=3397862 RepID=UPI0022200A78|nr:ATP-binding cassette domain-containing protein [Seramator thermalis]MCW1736124.1 ATP-binding cassette domain-containing protein [Seramator thermalis]
MESPDNEKPVFTLKEVKFNDILYIKELAITEKKTTAIVGKSGSGKTTLLKLLNKLISPDSGTIYYRDTPLEAIDSITLRREVVMMPQTPVIFEGDIRENLLIGLKFSEKELPSDDRLMNMLQVVGLDKKLDEPAHQLSGGEKQRLALARVMLMEPSVWLLDEPSSALDKDTEDEVMQKIMDFGKRNGSTIIFVTHSIPMAEKYAEEIIEIENGEIVSIKQNHHE